MDPTGGAPRLARTVHASGPPSDPATAPPRVPADILGNGEIIEQIKRETAAGMWRRQLQVYGDALRDGMWQT